MSDEPASAMKNEAELNAAFNRLRKVKGEEATPT
jgi:hypothetical protein